MNGKKILTKEGYKELQDELNYLKDVKHPELSALIKEAREQGDLSENAEYDAARDEQAKTQARIEEIEELLNNAEVHDDENADGDAVSIGCKVKIRDMEFKEDETYTIVGSSEVNSLKNKISNESPIGKAIVGAKVGQTIKVETPSGELKYKILEIERVANG